MTEKFKSEPRIGGKDWISILALNLTGNMILEWSCNFPSYSLGSLAIKKDYMVLVRHQAQRYYEENTLVEVH